MKKNKIFFLTLLIILLLIIYFLSIKNKKESFQTILSDPLERKTLNFIQKYLFYEPTMLYYPMSIGTASKDGNETIKKNYQYLKTDFNISYWSDPMDNNLTKKNAVNKTC